MSGSDFSNFFIFSHLDSIRPCTAVKAGNEVQRIEEIKYKISIKKVINKYFKILSLYLLNTLLILCQKVSESCKAKSKLPVFSFGDILDAFSFWFPKARKYGYYAGELYTLNEKWTAVLIPLPIIQDGSYKLWLFTFSRVERINLRLRNIWLEEILEELDCKFSHLIHFEHHFIVADTIRGKILPKFGRRSVYVIKSDYAWKAYEIAAKSIEGFVNSFRRNVKYGEDLLELCDEMERFAAILRKEAEGLKAKLNSTQPSPSHHPDADSSRLSRAEVVK